MRLVLLGPPGAGKGTQGLALAAHFQVPHVATGDIVRDHIARQTEFGRKIEAAIAAGNFASDEDILFWVARRLSEPDAQAGYILDGFPRDLFQAQAFQSSLNAVFWLAVSDQTLIERMTGRQVCPRCSSVYHVVHCPPRMAGKCDRDGSMLARRPEDAADKLQHRLELHESQLQPLEAYYSSLGLLIRVDAEGSPDTVTNRILDALTARPLAKREF